MSDFKKIFHKGFTRTMRISLKGKNVSINIFTEDGVINNYERIIKLTSTSDLLYDIVVQAVYEEFNCPFDSEWGLTREYYSIASKYSKDELEKMKICDEKICQYADRLYTLCFDEEYRITSINEI